MVTMSDIKKWVPLSKMEHADEDLYRERVVGAYEVEMPHGQLVRIPYVGTGELVQYYTEELIALCPVTFLPDHYNIRIIFKPGKYVPELKSLKYYLGDYMQLPISHEHLANKIYEEFKEQMRPKKLFVELATAVRGGIYTNIMVGDANLKKQMTIKTPVKEV